jgi:hypothetical protein
MNFSVRSTPYLGSLVRAPSGLSPSAVYDFSGAVYNRFYGGGMTPQPTEYTIAGWFKPKSISGYAGIAVRSNGNPTGAWTHTIYQNLGSQWVAYAYDGATRYVYSTTAPILNTWAHVAATAKNGGFERLYVNGVEEGTPAPVGTLWTGGNDWWVAVDDGTTGTNFVGYMADLAIWNKQLSAAEIASLTTGVRGLPQTVQPGNLLLFCPMDDAPIGSALGGDWKENVGGLSQTRTGAPVGRLDTPSIPVPPLPPASDNFESYPVGWLYANGTTITAGTNWNGAAYIFAQVTASDDFEFYVVGTISDAGTISAGTNFTAGAVIVGGIIATDTFEAYAVGPAYNGSNITSGVYWNGAASIS